MLSELLSDWRFLGAAAAALALLGEARYKLARHERLLDKTGQSGIERATMQASIAEMGRDISEIRSALDRLTERQTSSVERLWSSREESKERVAKMEGRMNGAV